MSTKYVYQGIDKVSIRRIDLEEMATNKSLTKTDYRVLLLLLTKLNGYNKDTGYGDDPCNFTKIKTKQISTILDISEEKVKQSVKSLRNLGYIEKGDSSVSNGGYRFRF